jgi:two-component system LytT family sensor kinase
MWGIAAGRLISEAVANGDSLKLVGALLIPPLLYWLLLLPVVLWFGIRFPLRRGLLRRSLPVHVGAAALLAAGYAELMVRVMGALIGSGAPAWAGSVADWSVRFQFGLLAYSFILSWGYVHEYFTALRAREVAVSRLEAELAQAQLRALKAQLQPHFLFNTLHAITVLIRHDSEAAGRMVMHLSDMLRMTLMDSERQETTLERELRLLRLYLEIEQTRFRDRLRVCWDIAPGLEHAAVPNLLLQPLVENALRHGLGSRGTPGTVEIGALRDDELLTLRIVDDGVGLDGGGNTSGAGIGISSTRARLAALYGTRHRFQLEDREGGGVTVTVSIPWRLLEETGSG